MSLIGVLCWHLALVLTKVKLFLHERLQSPSEAPQVGSHDLCTQQWPFVPLSCSFSLHCSRLSFRPPTNSQIMTWRFVISYECLALSQLCFSLSTFCLRTFYLSFILHILFSCFSCLFVCQLTAWLLAPGVSFSFSLILFSFFPSHSLQFILCLQGPLILFQPSYWLCSFLIRPINQVPQTGKVKQMQNFFTKLGNKCHINKCNTPSHKVIFHSIS